MKRAIESLEANAELFWPSELSERAKRSSVIPRLIETQDKFIGILYVADASPEAWTAVLNSTKGLSSSYFLKHLMVLCDLGGERLMRCRSNASSLFPSQTMRFLWNGKEHSWRLASLNQRSTWSNRDLGVDANSLNISRPLTLSQLDVAMLLLHGAACTSNSLPDDIADKCILGSMLGQKRELDAFVRRRYIHVSRITGGATANAMGQLCQRYVKERLEASLPGWRFSRTTIPGISQNDGRTEISFDIVAEAPNGLYCAIEVSFQVTTNSTIERKAGQAAARQRLLHRNGHSIAYVIDGAGNFARRSAIATIAAHSDCTVTFRETDLDRLTDFLMRMKRKR